ncbi:hypothetical protein NYZ99_19465 [Maribacter litopenaei]|uniref:Uncharacterized protein n=1 Tax=Maribacter litopenaei TaxID=2976127 RepID=A0ABY5Y957_9FLAO|nr:hypothetical protein [Maribacter litopenaei]UWX54887.1 hypothetical protein NYZ99_19465 [Maribacter litopenaei]
MAHVFWLHLGYMGLIVNVLVFLSFWLPSQQTDISTVEPIQEHEKKVAVDAPDLMKALDSTYVDLIPNAQVFLDTIGNASFEFIQNLGNDY